MVMELRTRKNPPETAETTKSREDRKGNEIYNCSARQTHNCEVYGRARNKEVEKTLGLSSLLQKSKAAAERVDEHEQPAETVNDSGAEEPVDEQAVASKDSNEMDVDAPPAEDGYNNINGPNEMTHNLEDNAPIDYQVAENGDTPNERQEDAPTEDTVQDGKMLSERHKSPVAPAAHPPGSPRPFPAEVHPRPRPLPKAHGQEENSGDDLANDPFSLFKRGPYGRTAKPHEVEEEGEVEADEEEDEESYAAVSDYTAIAYCEVDNGDDDSNEDEQDVWGGRYLPSRFINGVGIPSTLIRAKELPPRSLLAPTGLLPPTPTRAPVPARSRCHRRAAPIVVVAARSGQEPAPVRAKELPPRSLLAPTGLLPPAPTRAPVPARRTRSCSRSHRSVPAGSSNRGRSRTLQAGTRSRSCSHSHSRSRSRSRSVRPEGSTHRGRSRTPHAGKMCGVRATTLPPSSLPLPIEESELSHSSDDYAEAVAQKQRVKKRTREHGGRVSPGTETEEEEDLREHEEDMVPAAKSKKGKKSMKPAGPATRAGRSQSTARSKGKAMGDGGELDGTAAAPGTSKRSRGKAKAKDVAEDTDVDVVMYGDVTNDDEEDEEADGDGGSYKKGPIPQDAVDRLNQVYETFLSNVDEIAKDCGKSTHTLHQALGTTIKAARSLSAWNVWQRYWAEENGNPSNLDGATYTNTAREAFKEALRKASPDFTDKMAQDSAACFAALPWLAEWNEQLVTQAVVDIREAGKLKPRLRKEIKPVLAIAHQLQKEFGVYMLGFVINPQDHASFVFGNGDEVKEYRQSQLFNLNQQVKDMEHSFGVIDMRKRGLVTQGAPMKSLVVQSDEGKRDTWRRQFIRILGGQLWRLGEAANAWSGQDAVFSNFKMKWNVSFIEAARKSKCRIINYPAALEAAKQVIGTSTFNVKKIQQTTFEKFMPDLVKAQEHGTDDADVMVIVPWANDETDLPLEEQGDVGVVLNEEGRVLVYVKASDKYHQEVKAAEEKATKQARKEAKKQAKKETKSRAARGGAEEDTYGARKSPAPAPARHYSRDDGDLEHRHHENRRYEREDRYRARSPSGMRSRDYEAPVARLRDVSQQDLYEDRRRNSYSPPASYHGVYNNQGHEFGYESYEIEYGGARHREGLSNERKDYPRSPSPPPAGSSRQYRTSGHHQSVKQPPPGRHHSRSRSPLHTGLSRQYRTSGPHHQAVKQPPPVRRPSRSRSPPRGGSSHQYRTSMTHDQTLKQPTQGRGHSIRPVPRDDARTHAAPRGHGDSMHPGRGDHERARMSEAPQGDPVVLAHQTQLPRMDFTRLNTLESRVKNPSSAAKHIQYWDQDTKSWERLPDKTTPVFATEDDIGRYSRAKEVFGL
ncbi:hypothetical protein B0H14DRAFT_3665904 [Mycena olivaceomarginata]|nr:hypothetical protein B0H14DRAFT_3665904 [Mycena olivaceomarginata]